jgi:hypothetical protein
MRRSREPYRLAKDCPEPGARPLVIFVAVANSTSSFAAEEIFMSRSSRGLIRSLLALALATALVPAAQAYQAPKRHHRLIAHVAVVHHSGDIYVNRNTRSYLDPGPGPDYTSDDLYFEDTKYPQYLLGPGIFQRLNASPGQYN